MAEVPAGAVVLLPSEARVIEAGGFNVVVHATGDDTLGAFSLLETVDPTPGLGPPLHVHRDVAESFFVVAGEYAMHIEGRDFDCPAGSFVHVPVGMTHTFRSVAPGSRKLNLYTPSGMVGYFDELAEGLRRGLGEAGLDDIARRHGMEVTGTVPEGYL